MENAKNQKSEFSFDYGQNVFQQAYIKPPRHLNRIRAAFVDTTVFFLVHVVHFILFIAIIGFTG